MPKKNHKSQPRSQRMRNDASSNPGQQINAAFSTTTISIPKKMQLFPPRYRAWATTNIASSFNATSDSQTFKMNGVNLFGPQTGFSGAFGSNVPAGLIYLLSASSVAGSNAPYSYVTVLRQEITVRALTNNTNFAPFCVAVCYSPSASLSGLNLPSIREQPLTAWADVPSQTTAGAIVVRNDANCSTVAGVSPQVYRSDRDFWAQASADPNTLLYAHVLIRSLDLVSTLTGLLDIQFKTEYEFHGLNPFTSTTPTLARSATGLEGYGGARRVLGSSPTINPSQDATEDWVDAKEVSTSPPAAPGTTGAPRDFYRCGHTVCNAARTLGAQVQCNGDW